MTTGNPPPASSLVLYQTADARTRVQCRFEDETIWLTQAQMADVFQVTVPTVSEHLSGIYDDGEVAGEATIRNFRIVRTAGARKAMTEYEQFPDRLRLHAEAQGEADAVRALEDAARKLPKRGPVKDGGA